MLILVLIWSINLSVLPKTLEKQIHFVLFTKVYISSAKEFKYLTKFRINSIQHILPVRKFTLLDLPDFLKKRSKIANIWMFQQNSLT